MSNDRHQFEQGVEAYLDDTLTDAERAEFEQRFQEDGQLQHVVEQQQQINEALKRLFAAPPAPPWTEEHRLVAHKTHNGVMRSTSGDLTAASTPAAETAAPRTAGRLTWAQRLAVAASLCLMVLGGWLVWQVVSPSTGGGYAIGPWQPPQQVFAALDEPDWVCESDQEFMSTFDGRLGQPLVLEEPAEGPSMAGLAYRHSITRDTICVLGSANGEKIVVFVDRIEHDKGLNVPPESGLNVYRRTIGELVLYEVSRNDQPHLLRYFHRPAASSTHSRTGE